MVAAAQWPVWSTTARVVVTDERYLDAARQLVESELDAVDRACSRFRPDSEVCGLTGTPTRVSPVLAALVAAALSAASDSDGDVDPTVGNALVSLGYDRDLRLLASDGLPVPITAVRVPGWQRVRLEDDVLTVPDGVLLDLGATAKAVAADRCAALVAERCGVGVLVSLGGDIATAGPAPDGGWRILVEDPSCTVAIPSEASMATSSTRSRRWRRGGRLLHHVLDPRTSQPVKPLWRSVSVAADRCVDANTMTTAALVRGTLAPNWLRQKGFPARLVAADGSVTTLNGWPS